ncbi:MAG: flagellar basal body P-ring formation chaperone FlgA [Hydrogenovibrio sp.]|nr:flagellar basal body P-ring formation chaperone FlgA [Hydrogenovibrio sp.]
MTTPNLSNRLTRVFMSAMLLTLLSSNFLCASAQPTTPENQYQTAASLQKQALEYLKQKVDQKLKNPVITVNPVSNRLHLGLCQNPVKLEDKTPDKIAGRVSLKLSCSQPEWKLYVTASIDGQLPVIVSTRGILRETTIKASDVKQVYLSYRKVRRGAMTHLNNVIGMRAKRSIPPNKIITIRFLQPPYLVFKDQPIKIVTYAGEIKVETAGIALENGTKQQQIPIRNASSKKVIKGIVIAPNTVWVP